MSQVEPKTDRRKQRTRKLLRQALMELIIEKGYANISIQDITDRADVSRTTFYLHFKDKGELLAVGTREMYDEMVSVYAAFSPDEIEEKGYYGSFLEPTDYEHVANNAEFYRAMLSDKGSPAFVVDVQDYLAQVLNDFCLKLVKDDQQPSLPLDFVAHALAGMEIGIIHWWLHHDQMQHSSEMIAIMQYYLATYGIGKLLRGDVPHVDFETMVKNLHAMPENK